MSGLRDDEIERLAELLRRVADAGLGTPRLPGPVFAALRGVVAQPTAELLLTRPDGTVFLTWREDAHFRGWHLPGGFVGCGEDLARACERLGAAELGVALRFESIAGHAVWPDHPYASALCLLCRCSSDADSPSGRFFGVPPEPMLAPHRTLLLGAGYWGGAEPDASDGPKKAS